MITHDDPRIRQLIIELSDALCSRERLTGRASVMIIREIGGFSYRALDGKPDIPLDVSDERLLALHSAEQLIYEEQCR